METWGHLSEGKAEFRAGNRDLGAGNPPLSLAGRPGNPPLNLAGRPGNGEPALKPGGQAGERDAGNPPERPGGQAPGDTRGRKPRREQELRGRRVLKAGTGNGEPEKGDGDGGEGTAKMADGGPAAGNRQSGAGTGKVNGMTGAVAEHRAMQVSRRLAVGPELIRPTCLTKRLSWCILRGVGGSCGEHPG